MRYRKIAVTAILFLLVQNRQQTHDWILIGWGANGPGIQEWHTSTMAPFKPLSDQAWMRNKFFPIWKFIKFLVIIFLCNNPANLMKKILNLDHELKKKDKKSLVYIMHGHLISTRF